MRFRPLGSAPETSFVVVLAQRLEKIEKEIEVLRYKRKLLFDEAALHGYDKGTVRRVTHTIYP